MVNRVFKGLVLAGLGLGAALGVAKPAQAMCLPYITDDGRIVRICRQEAANDDPRGGFPGDLAPRHPSGGAAEERTDNFRGSGRFEGFLGQ